MARRSFRALAPLVAAQLLLAGCGQSPVTAQLATSASTAKPAAAAAAVQPSVTTTTAAAAASVSVAPTVTTQAGAAPTAASTQYQGLFDHDFSKDDVAKFQASQADASTATEVTRQYNDAAIGMADPSILTSWGALGAAIGAAVLGSTALGYALYTGVVGSKELIMPADKTDYRKDPGQWGMAYEPDWFYTSDSAHLKLVGWYIPAEVPTTKGILVLHGHTSNKDTALMKYGTMLHHDYNLYLYDSRFHGDSEGTFTTLGYYERNDAVQALQRLRDRGNTSVGIMGESMGAAVAIDAAGLDPNVKSCWADCAFDSLHDAVAPRAEKRGYPFPNYVASCVVATASIRAKGDLPKADPINWVAKISPRPLYLVHGQADTDTTPMNGEKLFDKAQEPKTMWRTPNAEHAQSWELYPDEYKTRMLTFFHDSL